MLNLNENLDRDGTLISDMKKYLDAAQARDILVVFVLWNGAVLRNQVSISSTFYDTSSFCTSRSQKRKKILTT